MVQVIPDIQVIDSTYKLVGTTGYELLPIFNRNKTTCLLYQYWVWLSVVLSTNIPIVIAVDIAVKQMEVNCGFMLNASIL